MKFIKVFVCILIFSTMTSCQSKVTKYTSEDATEYGLQVTKTSKATMIGIKTVNDDTVWTFEEPFDRGLKYQIFSVYSYDSTSTIEANTLTNNYTAMVFDYYLAQNDDIKDDFSISYEYLDGYKRSIYFTSEYEGREELKTKYDTFMTFMNYVKEENEKYSDKSVNYDVYVHLLHKNYDIWMFDESEFEELDEEHLSYAIIYNDYEALNEYSKEEINIWKENNTAYQICVRANEEDTWGTTEFYADDYHLSIASPVLYDLLSIDRNDTIQIEGDRRNYTITIQDEVYGPYQEEMIPFMTAQSLTGMQFQIKENLKNVDTLSEDE